MQTTVLRLWVKLSLLSQQPAYLLLHDTDCKTIVISGACKRLNALLVDLSARTRVMVPTFTHFNESCSERSGHQSAGVRELVREEKKEACMLTEEARYGEDVLDFKESTLSILLDGCFFFFFFYRPHICHENCWRWADITLVNTSIIMWKWHGEKNYGFAMPLKKSQPPPHSHQLVLANESDQHTLEKKMDMVFDSHRCHFWNTWHKTRES